MGVSFGCQGYEVHGDLSMLERTWPFIGAALRKPKRVVDLKFMNQIVIFKMNKLLLAILSRLKIPLMK